jgi:hypothetical protein
MFVPILVWYDEYALELLMIIIIMMMVGLLLLILLQLLMELWNDERHENHAEGYALAIHSMAPLMLLMRLWMWSHVGVTESMTAMMMTKMKMV